MAGFEELMQYLPCRPLYRFDWQGLQQSLLSSVLGKMMQTPQHPAWHGEGDVWAHTKMVCEALASLASFQALPLRQQQELALAALLHDAGKIRTTHLEDGILVSPGHAAEGAQMIRSLLWREYQLSGRRDLQLFRETVCQLIRYHTLPLHLFKGDDAERRIRKLAENSRLTPDFSVDLLCILAEADVRGRICADQKELLESVQLCRMLAKEAQCLHGPFPFPSAVTRHAYLSGRNVWPYQDLYDKAWGPVILLCGLPGTGKDTWIRNNCPGLPVVSMDDLRRKMGIRPTDEQGAIVQAAREQAREYLRQKRPFIWNATSLTPSLRRKSIQLFEEYGASVHIICLETGWTENLFRNQNRGHTVPEAVIGGMLEKFVLPEAWEARSVEWLCI